jgi:hypothetical protein
MWTYEILKYVWWWMWIEDANELIVAIGVLGVVTGIGPSPGQGQTTSGAGRWFPPFSHFDVYVLKWFTCDDILFKSLL